MSNRTEINMVLDENFQGELVKLTDIDNDFIINLRYSTQDNFTGKKIYDSNECWINKHTAKRLIEAKNIFRKDGYRVKIWDAYRPIAAQKKLWDACPDDDFVAMPPTISPNKKLRPNHMNGLCVDITLTDMDGNELEMPTDFDDFSEKAKLVNAQGKAKENGEYMNRVMASCGFRLSTTEWWHFFDITTPPCKFLNFKI